MGHERNLRHRKRQVSTPYTEARCNGPNLDESSKAASYAWFYLNIILGSIVMIVIGYKYALYCDTLHEAQLWFTNIKEVEREISFRTESGLYYSYFKQMVNAPSFSQGIYELSHDNITEHPTTMNVLERMNIYQEVFLAALYRTFTPLQRAMKPIFFYKYSVFALHGGLVCALYIMAWLLSGSWLSGGLAAAFYIFNKEDTTRVAYVIPLRESFSLPFLWAQLAILTYYFRPKRSVFQERLCVSGLCFTTFLFALGWQFNQFVLLLQSMALFGVQVLQLVPHYKIRTMYCVQLLSLLGVCVLQFFNTMIIGGLVFSFVPGAIALMYLQGERPSSAGIFIRLIKIAFYIVSVFILMLVTNTVIKLFIHVDSDEHIYKFVLHKLGIEDSKDFDVWMYLCVGSFNYLTFDVIQRLSTKLIFPIYIVSQFGGLLIMTKALFSKWRYESEYKKNEDEKNEDQSSWLEDRPELAYHFVQTVFFGGMALTTLRMKYLWTPYMCVLGSTLVADKYIYTFLLSQIQVTSKIFREFLRILVCIAIFCALYYMCIDGVRQELGNLREFYDPDTVALMEWINNNTPSGAAFTGSMQLLAGVKLCTGRPITNHPHYEDKALRHTTKQILQMYGRRTAEEVHGILKHYQSSYIIVEDSICMVPATRECGTPNLIDMSNAVTSLKDKAVEGVQYTTAPKFCDQIRHMREPYNKYFKEVFKNRTFRVYQVL